MNSSREYRTESSIFLTNMSVSQEHEVLETINDDGSSPLFPSRSTQMNTQTGSTQNLYITQSPTDNTQPNNDDLGSRSTEVYYSERTPVRQRRWFSKIHESLFNGKISAIKYFLSFGITPLDDSFRYTGYFGNMLLRNPGVILT